MAIFIEVPIRIAEREEFDRVEASGLSIEDDVDWLEGNMTVRTDLLADWWGAEDITNLQLTIDAPVIEIRLSYGVFTEFVRRSYESQAVIFSFGQDSEEEEWPECIAPDAVRGRIFNDSDQFTGK